LFKNNGIIEKFEGISVPLFLAGLVIKRVTKTLKLLTFEASNLKSCLLLALTTSDKSLSEKEKKGRKEKEARARKGQGQ